MERLTEKIGIFGKNITYIPTEKAFYNHNNEKKIDVQKIIDKLGQFEDFMESRGIENIQ